MNGEASTSSSKSEESSNLYNEQVYPLLKQIVEDQTRAADQDRNRKLLYGLIAILIVFAIILFVGGEHALRNYVNTAVDQAAESVVEGIKFDSEATALNVHILNLDRSSGFTEREAEAIISQIESLVSKADEQELHKLVFASETAVENFAAADRLDLAIRLDGIASNLLRNSASVIDTMVQASGFSLLGDPNWEGEGGDRSEIYENYQIYIDIAKNSGYPELYYLYEMLLAHVQEPQADRIGDLIRSTGTLEPRDAAHFKRIMVALATEEIVRESTEESRKVAERVTRFLCDYREQGDLLHETFEEAELEC